MRHVPETLAQDRALLLVVDVQEKFRPHIAGWDAMVAHVDALIKGCVALDVPIIVTEQYPKGLGHTIEELAEGLTGVEPVEKRAFSSLGAPEVVAQLDQFGRDQIIVCGIEAHVALDAIASRTASSREVGVRRMRAAGMVPSGVELALFEMMISADHPQFKTISGLVRDLPQSFS
ncbi:MAG: isochorismatase family protein [Actinobacteria bacterium]|nr:isochorismatase family protein [Actinomycetota bacterium]